MKSTTVRNYRLFFIEMAGVKQKAMFVLWFYVTKSAITAQRRFCFEYPNRHAISKDSIKRWYQQCKDAGTVQHRKGAGRPSFPDDIVEQVTETFTKTPTSMHRASLQLGKLFFTKLSESFLSKVVLSDEARFHVSGNVNHHNCRVCGCKSPCAVRLYQRTILKVNVWCGLAVDEVIGPVFFHEFTVTSFVYIGTLQCYAAPKMEHRQQQVFEQDYAPPP